MSSTPLMIATFGRVVGREGENQRFLELVEKENLLMVVDFITPILDQSPKSSARFSWDGEAIKI